MNNYVVETPKKKIQRDEPWFSGFSLRNLLIEEVTEKLRRQTHVLRTHRAQGKTIRIQSPLRKESWLRFGRVTPQGAAFKMWLMTLG